MNPFTDALFGNDLSSEEEDSEGDSSNEHPQPRQFRAGTPGWETANIAVHSAKNCALALAANIRFAQAQREAALEKNQGQGEPRALDGRERREHQAL